MAVDFLLLEESRKEMLSIAKSFSDKLGKNFGVTFVQDQFGEFGNAGTIYLTIRHKAEGIGDCHMTMVVKEIKKGMV